MNINDEKDLNKIYQYLNKTSQEGRNIIAAFRIGCICARQNLMQELIYESLEKENLE